MILRALLALIACLLALLPAGTLASIPRTAFVPPPVALFGVEFSDEQDCGPLTLHLDGLHDRAGPCGGVLVRQNPWSAFDPEGLSGDRTDPDGFKWSDREHHVVPRAPARDAGWCADAKDVFNKATIETPNGHNFSAHGHYNREVRAEMDAFLGERAPHGVSQFSAREQRKLAEEFVEQITHTQNKFIKGFNANVREGPGAVARWFDSTGKNVVLKSSGKIAAEEGIALGSAGALRNAKGPRIGFLGGTLRVLSVLGTLSAASDAAEELDKSLEEERGAGASSVRAFVAFFGIDPEDPPLTSSAYGPGGFRDYIKHKSGAK